MPSSVVTDRWGLAAAQALESEFSEDGLTAMVGEDNLPMALAKSLADRIDEADMQQSWTKVTSGPKTSRKSITPRSVSDLPVELQLVGEALFESQSKPIPPDTKREFLGVLGRIAAVDEAFAAAVDFDSEVASIRATANERFQPTTMPVSLKFIDLNRSPLTRWRQTGPSRCPSSMRNFWPRCSPS